MDCCKQRTIDYESLLNRYISNIWLIIDKGVYDIELLSEIERQQIEDYLTVKD
jgi:hypothetical protein